MFGLCLILYALVIVAVWAARNDRELQARRQLADTYTPTYLSTDAEARNEILPV